MAVEEVPPQETHQYGIVAVGRDDGHTFEITGMVEKPKSGSAPSNLIISGRYILQPEIFEILELVEKGAGGEVQLTDGMIQLARTQSFHGVRFDGRTYDCGSRLGFLSANIAFALDRSDLAPGLKEVLRSLGFVSKGV
jgi:UTP--glucose-1-phosphate uridylyltransferase